MTDWQAIRDEYPAVSASTYLNTAAGAPVSRAAARAGAGYYETTARDGDVHWDAWLDRVEAVRGQVAAYLGAEPAEIGFTHNASAAMNHTAGMLRGRGAVLAVRDDFPSITLPWMQTGFEVDFVDGEDDGSVPLDRLAAAIGPRTRILALGWVHYRTGYRFDLRALGELCRDRDLLLVVDATQGLGAFGVDVSSSGIDFLACSGYKWLTAGYGVGFLFAARRHLSAEGHPVAGWRSARVPYDLVADRLDLTPDASALEMGHPPFPAVFSLGESLAMLRELGTAEIDRRVVSLSSRLRERLATRGLDVVTGSDRAHASGIVFVRVREPAALRDRLRRRGVLVSARGDGIRLSTHLYNDREDLDRLEQALDDCGAAP